MEGSVAEQIEAAGESLAVRIARETDQRLQQPLGLLRSDGTQQRMAEPHHVFRSLQIGELPRVVLHGSKQLTDRFTSQSDFGPIVTRGGVEQVLVLIDGEAHRARGDTAPWPAEKGLDKAKVEPGKAGAKAELTPVKPAAGKDKGGQSAPSKPAAPDKNRPAPAQPASEGAKGAGKAKPAAAVAKPVDKKTEAHKPESHQPDVHKTDSHAEGDGKGADKKGKPSAVAPVSKETKKPAPPVKTEPAKSDTAKPIVGKPAAAKPGTGKPGSVKPDNHKSDHHKSDSSKSAGHKASGPPAKSTGKKPTEGKSSEGKSSDGGASKSKTASKQLTRRKPR